MVADHLSILHQEPNINGEDKLPIDDSFIDEQLLAISIGNTPWYADLVNYLACGILPLDMSF